MSPLLYVNVFLLYHINFKNKKKLPLTSYLPSDFNKYHTIFTSIYVNFVSILIKKHIQVVCFKLVTKLIVWNYHRELNCLRLQVNSRIVRFVLVLKVVEINHIPHLQQPKLQELYSLQKPIQL